MENYTNFIYIWLNNHVINVIFLKLCQKYIELINLPTNVKHNDLVFSPASPHTNERNWLSYSL